MAEIFLKCEGLLEAQKMSAMVFGLERPYHFKGETVRETDSMNQSVYEEPAAEYLLRPRIRTYREKTRRSSISDTSREKQAARDQMMQQLKEDRAKIAMLEQNGRIDFARLPVIEPRVREILLKWLSDALEDSDFCARTDDSRQYYLDMNHAKEKCVVHCEDGSFTMPSLSIVFQEE